VSAQEIRAGRAYVELTSKDVSLRSGLEAGRAHLMAFGAAITTVGQYSLAAGALITTPMAAAAKSAADTGSALYQMSKRTGVSVESLSALGYAAEQTQSNLEAVEVAIRQMQKSITGTKDELEGTSGKIDFLGLDAEKLRGLRPEEQFAIIADRIRAIKDPTDRAAAAMAVFGRRNGTALLPMIESLEELSDRAAKLGLIRSSAWANDMNEFSDAMQDTNRVARSLWETIATAVIPILKRKTEQITQYLIVAREWLKKNQELIRAVFQIGVGFTIAGVSLIVFGKAISTIGQSLGFAITAFNIAAGVLGYIGSAIAFLLSPMGLVAAALVAGTVLWARYTTSGQNAMNALKGAGMSVVSTLLAAFGVLKTDAIDTFEAARNALLANDLGAAAAVAWAMIKLEWTRGIIFLEDRWDDFKNWLTAKGYQGFHGLVEGWEAARHLLNSSWISFTGFLKELWVGLLNSLSALWDKFTFGVARATLYVKSSLDSTINYQGELTKINNQEAYNANIRQIEAGKVRRENLGKQNDEDKRHTKAIEDNDAALEESLHNLEKFISAHEGVGRDLEQQAELDKAKAEYEAALKRARDARPAPTDVNPLSDILKKLDDGRDFSIAQAAGKFSSRGTFNPAEVAGLAAKDLNAEIAKNTEDTRKAVEKNTEWIQALFAKLRFSR